MAKTATKTSNPLSYHLSVRLIATTIPKEYVQRLADFLWQAWLNRASVYITVNSSRRHSTQHNACYAITKAGGVVLQYKVAKRTTVEQLYQLTVEELKRVGSNCAYTAALLAVLERAHQNSQPQLGIIWAMPPAPPKPRLKRAKLTLVERRAEAARSMLVKWQRRLKYAKTKVQAYKRKCEYYQSKGVQS